VLTGFFDFVIAIVIAFWALKDLPKLRQEIVALPGPKYRDDVEHLLATVTRVVGGYLKGQTVASLCTGAITAIGLAILGVPYALVLGILTFFLNYVPYVGPFIGGLVAGLVGLTQGPWTGLFAVGVVVLAQNLTDNLVTPRVMSEQVDLHPTLVIFSLLVGGTLFGIPGMLFAIPVAATGKGLFVYYYEQRTSRQLASEDGALFKGAGCDPDDETAQDCDDSGAP
jgi:predicted PurR-regulated permease PerM